MKGKYTIPTELHDRKIAEQVKKIEERENKNKYIVVLYGICVLEIGNLGIRKRLDIMEKENKIKEIKGRSCFMCRG